VCYFSHCHIPTFYTTSTPCCHWNSCLVVPPF
jgi:hypothetical protein